MSESVLHYIKFDIDSDHFWFTNWLEDKTGHIDQRTSQSLNATRKWTRTAPNAIDANRLVYYRTYRRRPRRWLIKVVVEAGEIVTAYRVKRLKQGEKIIWQR